MPVKQLQHTGVLQLGNFIVKYSDSICLNIFVYSTTAMLTLFSQVMVNVKFPYVVYRKGVGLEIRSFALFKLFPVR